MKKYLLLFVAFVAMFVCGCTKVGVKSFEKILDDAQSYVCEGILESFYDNGKKETTFTVYYQKPDNLKVVFSENDNKQVVLKNKDGVFILIPAVNKNFKIDSSWPANASYPYLLESLKEDVCRSDALKTENESTYTIETKSKMFNEATETLEKVTFDSKTNLPTEVLVYDLNNEVYLRVSFTSIEINKNISSEEFEIADVMTALRNDELTVFENREFLLPTYVPEGYSTSKEDTLVSGSEDELVSIMKFTGQNSFTIIQEYVNDSETLQTVMTSGEIVVILGNIGLYRGESVEVYSDGILYTLASENLGSNELMKIMTSYFSTPEK